ncbi:MAG: CDP-glycerol glycerophosphotransferase family protein, partial [Trebonia sp.]
MLFVSWKGKQCADNPLAIAAELRRRGDGREQIWAVTDYSRPAPPGARTVLTGTRDYFEAVARCRYLISNDDMPAHYRKPKGQFYLQTWHGTTLKRIGFDVEDPRFISGATYLRRLAADVARWDLLLSPNPFSTAALTQAFRYAGEVRETGYPRNDVLSSADRDEIAARVRNRLGLPAGKRVVLYAPTWRDDRNVHSGRYRFDLALDVAAAREALGEDHVLLLRGHHIMANDVTAGDSGGFCIDVTGYPEIADLYLLADVLITDYSSAMFDFAATGKPILLFTYDLEHYRDELRGFYFDFEEQAPGPLLRTSQDVITALRDIDPITERYRSRYADFVARYCPLDDGKASARAIEA